MAKKLDAWPRPSKSSAGNALYDWDLWLNGEAWKITRGIDFTCTVHSMQNYIYIAAKRRNVTVETALHRNGITISFIANPQ